MRGSRLYCNLPNEMGLPSQYIKDSLTITSYAGTISSTSSNFRLIDLLAESAPMLIP